MEKLIEMSRLPRLSHGKIKNLNRLMMSKESESVIKNINPPPKSPEPDATLDNSTNIYSRINTNPPKTHPKKIEVEIILLNSFLEYLTIWETRIYCSKCVPKGMFMSSFVWYDFLTFSY